MITDTDVKKLKAVFVTKKDLKNTEHVFDKKLQETEERLNKRIDRGTEYINFHLEPLQQFKKDFEDFKNKMFDRFDWLFGKYKKFEDEHVVLTEQTNRVNGKLDNHEERIISLEQRVEKP
ncbi:MAG: hypothetical protein AAB437_01210 [Patescibacteria group bacterium]